MKRLFYTFVLALLFSSEAKPQDIILNLTATIDEIATNVDSIVVVNVNNETHFVLDDLPELQSYAINISNKSLLGGVGIIKNQYRPEIEVLKNNLGEVVVGFYSVAACAIKVSDITGKIIASYKSKTAKNIAINLPKKTIYILTIIQGKYSKSFKAIGSEYKNEITFSESNDAILSGFYDSNPSNKSSNLSAFEVGNKIELSVYKSGFWSESYWFGLSASQQINLRLFDASFIDEVMDVNGNVYRTVKIGEQWWMAENLRAINYPNNDAIPEVILNNSWIQLGNNNTGKGYCWYEGNTEIENYKYGALYTFAAAVNGTPENGSGNVQGVCPDGWHVPSHAEWSLLTDYLSNNGFNYDGSIGWSEGRIAKSMASINDWQVSSRNGSPGDKTLLNNASGFSALPTGVRYDGIFGIKGGQTGWWSSSEVSQIPTEAWKRHLYFSDPNLTGSYMPKSTGLSVRCVKD